jgi:hypothetical protein
MGAPNVAFDYTKFYTFALDLFAWIPSKSRSTIFRRLVIVIPKTRSASQAWVLGDCDTTSKHRCPKVTNNMPLFGGYSEFSIPSECGTELLERSSVNCILMLLAPVSLTG